MVSKKPLDHSRRDPKLSKLPNLPDESSFKIVSKALKPEESEVIANPRSRSATLRVIEKIK